MERALARLVQATEWWAALLLGLMVALVAAGVFFRYALNAALPWYDEFASYLLVWLTFCGSVVASYRRRHIAFETLVERLAPPTRRALEAVAEILVLGFQLALCYYGWLLARKMGDERAVSLAWVKMGWIYSALPISGALMFVVGLARLCKIAAGAEKGAETAWSGSSSE